MGLTKRFQESTRGQIVELLRRGPHTVEDLSRALDLTENGIRAHLSTLERDGIVGQKGVRRSQGAGKPANLYELQADAEPMLSRAYVPVLSALLDELATRSTKSRRESLMRAVGKRLATAVAKIPGAALEARVASGVALLNALGGDARSVRDGQYLVISGHGCPLSAATSHRPELCLAVEALLSDVIGAPVSQSCHRGERPQCRFTIPSAA